MAVDSINGIQHYPITPASDSQNRKQSQRDRSHDDSNSSREEEREKKQEAEPSQSGGELGQILDTSTVVELLNHRPKSAVPAGKSTSSYPPKSKSSK